MGSSEPLSWEDKGEHDDAEKCQKIHPLPNEAKILEIAKEDRTIGVVTFRLYCDYFRSGAHPLMITGMVGLSFITQGKRIVRVSYKAWVRAFKGIQPPFFCIFFTLFLLFYFVQFIS